MRKHKRHSADSFVLVPAYLGPQISIKVHMRTAAGTHRNTRRLAVNEGLSSNIFIHRYSSHGV
jgi:hypothetical protein